MTIWTGGGRPVICGHRGASRWAPENTIESFALAATHGATWIEFDVRPAAEGVLIIHHDSITADGRLIADTAQGDLVSVPTLDQLLAWNAERGQPLGLDIELKTDDIGLGIEEFVDAVGRGVDAHPGAEVIVTSFDLDALAIVRRRRSDLATGLLYKDIPGEQAIERALADGHVAIVPAHGLVESEIVDAAHRVGLSVATWTVNAPADAVRVTEAGVDMVIGDDPRALSATLNEPDRFATTAARPDDAGTPPSSRYR